MPALWGLEGRPFLAGSDPGERLQPTLSRQSLTPELSRPAKRVRLE